MCVFSSDIIQEFLGFTDILVSVVSTDIIQELCSSYYSIITIIQVVPTNILCLKWCWYSLSNYYHYYSIEDIYVSI